MHSDIEGNSTQYMYHLLLVVSAKFAHELILRSCDRIMHCSDMIADAKVTSMSPVA